MIKQQTFADVCRSRSTDPATSHEAARSARGVAREHERIILTVMRGGSDWTAHEIAEASGLTSTQVCRRFAELRNRDLIEATINTRPTPSGRGSQCYEIAGRQGRAT